MKTNKIAILLTLLLVVSGGTPAAFATDASAAVDNEAPTVDSVSLDATFAPSAGTTTAVAVTITVSDGNGYQDISSVDVTVYKPDGTLHVASAAATSNADGSGTTQTYSYTFNMQFYHDPATGGAKYNVTATATDAAAATSAATTTGFNYTALAALNLSASSISFGTISPGARSSTSTLSVSNYGNVRIDIATSGTDLSDGASHTIAASNVKYDLLAADMLNEQGLTTSAFTNTGFDLATGASSSAGTYWELAVPAGSAQYIPAGDYTGTIAISAIQG